MTSMTVGPAVAPGNVAEAQEPKISTLVNVIVQLSMASAVLSLIIAGALSLIIWTAAG
jgi:hypothetical protein